jgi:hypothetical protein
MAKKDAPMSTLSSLWKVVSGAATLYIIGFVIVNTWLGSYGLATYSLPDKRFLAAGILYLALSLLGGLWWIGALTDITDRKRPLKRAETLAIAAISVPPSIGWMLPLVSLVWIYLFRRGDLMSLSQILPWLILIALALGGLLVGHLAKATKVLRKDSNLPYTVFFVLSLFSVAYGVYAILVLRETIAIIVVWCSLSVIGVLLTCIGVLGFAQTKRHIVDVASGLLILLGAVILFGRSLYGTIPQGVGGGNPSLVRITATSAGCKALASSQVVTVPLSSDANPPCLTEAIYILEAQDESYFFADGACGMPSDKCHVFSLRESEVTQINYGE